MTQKEFQQLLRKYREGQCSVEEQRLVDAWFNGISMGDNPFSNKADEARLKEGTWTAVDEHISRSAPQRKKAGRIISFRAWSVASIAASILLGAVLYIYVQTKIYRNESVSENDRLKTPGFELLTNDSNAPLAFTLADSSIVTLMPHSLVRFSSSFAGTKREVFLEGEAFFDVARDASRPFLVYTREITTEVLGTSFRVSAYEDEKEIVVTVKTGKVSVYPKKDTADAVKKSEKEIILMPNQQAVYHTREKITLKRLVPKPEIIVPQAPLDTRYTNTSVVHILQSLERSYGIDIEYDSAVLANCTLISDMSEEGFYEQIKIVCNALGAEYKISENAVVIMSDGCQAF